MQITKKALYSFLDLGFDNRVCAFVIRRTAMEPVLIKVRSGFVSGSDAAFAFGEALAAAPETDAGFHLSSILIKLVRRKGVWKGKNLKEEFVSLLEEVAVSRPHSRASNLSPCTS